MLGYVSREVYDEAVGRAARAEGEAEALRGTVGALEKRLAAGDELVAKLLDKALPDAPAREAEAPPSVRDEPGATSADIMRQPAIGRRGLAERERLMREVQEREEVTRRRGNQHPAGLALEEDAELAAELEGA